MSKLNFDEERINFTPVTLFVDYINLQFQDYLKHNYSDITPRDFTYLVNIFYNPNISQKELSKMLYVSESNVTQIIKRLEKNELISRVCDENNKAKKIISLTEKGKIILFSVLKEVYEEESKILDKYSDEDVKMFKKMLYEFSERSIENNQDKI